ncbi:ABC transporter ATP-binding protein [Desulfocicer niacini]
MENNALIKVENVSKKFCRSLNRSMLYGVQDISKDILGINSSRDKLRKNEFWSLKNISFEVRRGECLGIIGPNGAGKSTLLKMINGIILPDKGKITTKGKVGSLVEIGSGFHPMLSGRENIYINGSILGMSKKKIDKNFDSIVEFAELADTIDMPVKHYSSGMYVRLGFAVAAHVIPDVLILDEVLAVGDMAFVAKCFQHLSEIKKKTAIILVSHDMRNISRICNRSLFINNGEQLYLGNTEQAIKMFRTQISHDDKKSDCYNSDIVEIKHVNVKNSVEQFNDIKILIIIKVNKKISLFYNVAIHRIDGVHCCGILSKEDDLYTFDKGKFEIKLKLNKCSIMPGRYKITVALWNDDKTGLLSLCENITAFTVVGNEDTQGVFMPEHNWFVKTV